MEEASHSPLAPGSVCVFSYQSCLLHSVWSFL
jgi:hypothetical protein